MPFHILSTLTRNITFTNLSCAELKNSAEGTRLVAYSMRLFPSRIHLSQVSTALQYSNPIFVRALEVNMGIQP